MENARRAVALAALHGNLHIRAFADVDGKARLEAVRALIRVRDEFRGIVDLQVVAFAQDGIVREPGAADLMHEAMALGADVVGGIPWIELTDDDAAAHIRICFDLACELRQGRLDAARRRRRSGFAHAGNDGGRSHQARLAEPGAGASLPRHEPLSRALCAAARAAVAFRGRRGGDRSAYRAAACARQGIARRRRSRLPRPGRYFRRLLRLRPQQHAGGGVPGRAPVVDDDAAGYRGALRHDHRRAGQAPSILPDSASRSARRRISWCSISPTRSRRCAITARRRTSSATESRSMRRSCGRWLLRAQVWRDMEQRTPKPAERRV